nr:BTB (POZ) domain containing 9 [Hymenolepis microstoma]
MSGEETISLKVDHSAEIVDDIAVLLKTKDYSDITLVVGDAQFPCHRVILASRCEYFRALLFGGLAETHSSSIRLNGISSTAFYYILEYIYTGKLDISGANIEDACDVLGLVCQYNFSNLQDDLSRNFIQSLNVQNVCLLYDSAITYDLEDLIDACLQTIDRYPAIILTQPQFLRLSRASVVRMLSRDSFYIPEIEILRGVQAWLEADYQSRFEKSTAIVASSSSPSVSVSFVDQQQHQVQQFPKDPTLLASMTLKKNSGLLPATRSNSSESLFSSASTSDSGTSVGAKSKTSDSCSAAIDEVRVLLERETAEARAELVGCIRFELMTLAELSTDVRASRLLSPDDLLDKISAKMRATPTHLPIRGRLLPEVNLAVSRLGCSLLKGQRGNYPFFFVDNGGDPNETTDDEQQNQQSHGAASRRRHRHNQSRSVWDASSDWMASTSRPFDRDLQLRGRGDALANASAWGFMDNVAISTAATGWSASGVPQLDGGFPVSYQHRDAQSGPTGALMHLNCWLLNSASSSTVPQQTGSLPSAISSRRTPHEPPPESELSVVSHRIWVRDESIIVDLGHNSFVNLISMQLWDRESRSYAYYVEVSQSLEDSCWEKVVDYSNYACRSWQMLYFPTRIIRYIRIVGTRSSVGKHFHIISFQCLYTRTKLNVQNGLLVPRTNVATIHHGATVLEGVSRLRNSLIDGDFSVYNLNYGFTCHQLGNGSIDVQLSQPFLVSSMRFLLWDLDSRAYSYIVEVSQDRLKWSVVFDATQLLCRSWQTINFPLQPVTFIRITGTGNTANDVFHIVHLECPATVLDPSDDTLVGEGGQDNAQQSPRSSQSINSGANNEGSNGVISNNRGSTNRIAINGPPGSTVYVDAVSALRHQRPRLLEVEEPSTPSSSLVADLSTFSLHSEATLDATGTETTGDASQPVRPLPIPHYQRRRRRRYHHNGRHQQRILDDDEESYHRGATSATNSGIGNNPGGGDASMIANSMQYFSGNSRATSLSSVNRNDSSEANRLSSLNVTERIQQDLPLLRSSSESSLDSSGNAPTSELS